MESKETLTKTNERVPVANSQLNKQPNSKEPAKVIGILTSRIEVKPSSSVPAYGFFSLEGIDNVDIPVIFRIKENENWIKPLIKKGSTCELTGYFTDSKDKERPSFTCSVYQILQEPKPLTSSELQTLISGLLSTSLEKKKEWTQRTDFLFKKHEELKEIEALSKLGHKFLDAYLTLKWAHYSNYQEKYLAADFDLTHYLATISTEIQLVKSHIEAYQSKQVNHGK